MKPRTGVRMHQLKRFKCLCSIMPALVFLPMAAANTITFDESPAPNNGVPYGATVLGATFSATNAGIWDGISNGDPGSWGLQGTNGPTFLGFNGNGGYSEVVTFASSVSSLALDFSRSDGSTDGTITLQAFNGATLLGSTSTVLGPINTRSIPGNARNPGKREAQPGPGVDRAQNGGRGPQQGRTVECLERDGAIAGPTGSGKVQREATYA